MRKMVLVVAVVLGISSTVLGGQQSADERKDKPQDSAAVCPMHDAHSKMNERGEKGMGFSQTATAHHFFLKPDGGVIQVEVRDAADITNRDNIRMHLTHIAHAFASGDFDIPMFVHDGVPPGVVEMKQGREKIRYLFEETEAGGRVVISTGDKDALAAIHKFLRFQIKEHGTGDLMEIK